MGGIWLGNAVAMDAQWWLGCGADGAEKSNTAERIIGRAQAYLKEQHLSRQDKS